MHACGELPDSTDGRTLIRSCLRESTPRSASCQAPAMGGSRCRRRAPQCCGGWRRQVACVSRWTALRLPAKPAAAMCKQTPFCRSVLLSLSSRGAYSEVHSEVCFEKMKWPAPLGRLDAILMNDHSFCVQGFGAALAEVLRRHDAALQALPASAAAARSASVSEGAAAAPAASSAKNSRQELTLMEVGMHVATPCSNRGCRSRDAHLEAAVQS